MLTLIYCVVGAIVSIVSYFVISADNFYKQRDVSEYLLCLLIGTFWPATVPVVLYYGFGKDKP